MINVIITEQIFEEQFKPQHNILKLDIPAEKLEWSGWKYDISGPEFEYVRQVLASEPDRVWTILDNDGMLVISNGYHHINRMGYIITEIPCPEDKTVEAMDDDDIDRLCSPVIHDDDDDEKEEPDSSGVVRIEFDDDGERRFDANGKLHCDTGPAVLLYGGVPEIWRHGIKQNTPRKKM